MGNIIRKKNRIIPEGYVSPNTHNKLMKKYLKIFKKLEKTKKESEYECCVCYDRTYKNKKKIRCDHNICKGCYDRITDKKCPLCRRQMTIYIHNRIGKTLIRRINRRDRRQLRYL